MHPYEARARAALSRHPKTYSRLKGKVDGGIPSEGGIEPSNPRPLFGIFESASMAASRLLSNGA
jgi:hypothetical protein